MDKEIKRNKGIDMLDWIAASFELLGMYLIGSKKKIGFLMLMVCSILWILVAIHEGIYGLIIAVVPCFLMNCRNFKKWAKEDSKQRQIDSQDKTAEGP